MGILCVFCVYDTIGNRCFEKTSFPKTICGIVTDILILIGSLGCLEEANTVDMMLSKWFSLFSKTYRLGTY